MKKLLPLVVKPCQWRLSRFLKGLEIRPKHRDSVASGTTAEQEADFADLTGDRSANLLNAPASGPASERDAAKAAGGEIAGPRPGAPRDGDYAILEVGLRHREWDRYTVELILTTSDGVEAPAPLRDAAAFDLPALLAITDPVDYATRLQALLIPDQPQRDLVQKARAAATALGTPLRVRIAVDSCARELHCLPWELLTEGSCTRYAFVPANPPAVRATRAPTRGAGATSSADPAHP